jgi:hypothetical protein
MYLLELRDGKGFFQSFGALSQSRVDATASGNRTLHKCRQNAG